MLEVFFSLPSCTQTGTGIMFCSFWALCHFRNDTDCSVSDPVMPSNRHCVVQGKLTIAIQIKQALSLILTKAKVRDFHSHFCRRSSEKLVIQFASVRAEILIQALPAPKTVFFMLRHYADMQSS